MNRFGIFVFSLLISGMAFADSEIKVVRFAGLVKVGQTLVKEVGQKIAIPETGVDIDTTAAESFLILRDADDSIFRFANGSAKFKYGKASLVEIVKGSLFAYVQKSFSKSEDAPAFRLKGMIMGVRGTKFFLQEDEKESYLCVCEGVVEAKGAKGSKVMQVQAGYDLTAHSDRDIEKPAFASDVMWKMAKDGFADMGYDVPKRKK